MLVSKFAVKSIYAGVVTAPVKCIDILDCINTLISQYYSAFKKNVSFVGFCEYIPLKKQFFYVTSDMWADEVFYNLKEALNSFAYSRDWETVDSLNLDKEVLQCLVK